jgi:hypothetical protein
MLHALSISTLLTIWSQEYLMKNAKKKNNIPHCERTLMYIRDYLHYRTISSVKETSRFANICLKSQHIVQGVSKELYNLPVSCIWACSNSSSFHD